MKHHLIINTTASRTVLAGVRQRFALEGSTACLSLLQPNEKLIVASRNLYKMSILLVNNGWRVFGGTVLSRSQDKGSMFSFWLSRRAAVHDWTKWTKQISSRPS